MSETEKKVRSIRVDDTTYAKFKEICEQTGGQNDALIALISSYELETAKNVLTGQATMIDDFKSRADGIVKAYISTLELLANTEERIGIEYDERLRSKDEIIIQLQSEKQDLQNQCEQIELACHNLQQTTALQIAEMKQEAEDKESKLQNAVDHMSEVVKAREQAERISAMATEQVDQLKLQITELTAKAEQSNSYQIKAEQTAIELKKHEAIISELTEQLKTEQINKEKELEVAEREKDIAVKSAIAEVTAQYQRKIDELQEKQIKQLEVILQSTKQEES